MSYEGGGWRSRRAACPSRSASRRRRDRPVDSSCCTGSRTERQRCRSSGGCGWQRRGIPMSGVSNGAHGSARLGVRAGVVRQSARGPLPNLADRIAGEPIRGGWRGHWSGHEIFAVLIRVLDSGEVVATRLVDGKVTCSTVGSGRLLCVSLIGLPLSTLQPLTSCTRHPVRTRRSRFPSPSGSPPGTSPPRRYSPSTRRSRCFLGCLTDLDCPCEPVENGQGDTAISVLATPSFEPPALVRRVGSRKKIYPDP